MAYDHLLPIIFIYIPEALLTIYITCALLGVKVEWQWVMPMGMVYGTIMYTVGYLTGNYILVMLIHYCLVVSGLLILKISELYETAICTAITFSIVLMLEFICLNLISLAVDIHPKILVENIRLRIQVFAVQILLALGIYHVLRYLKLSIFDER